MKLNIVGSIFGTSGYDVHTKCLSEALMREGIDVGIECAKPFGWEFGAPDIFFCALKKDYKNEVSLVIGTPPFYAFKWADGVKKLIGFVVWEGDKVPSFWFKNLLLCDQLWVPSKHVFDAIKNTFSLTKLPPIFIVPHGVDSSIFYPIPKEESRPFTFVYNKGWRGTEDDRGGVQYLLKAFREEFGDDPSVRLMIKLNMAYDQSGEVLEGYLKSTGLKEVPSNIEFINHNMFYKELKHFYNSGDVFVMPTRAEGFGLTALEAMACAKPCITTNYGGQTDYVNNDNGWLINYELTPITHDLMYKGIRWATPNIKHLKELMRYAYEHPDEVKKKGECALKTSKEWSWNNTALKAINALNKL